MLIKNGKLVDLANDKDYLKFKRGELDKLPNPVVVKSPRPVKINKTGLKEEPPVFNIRLVSSIQTEDGLEEWTFTRHLKRDPKSGDYLPEKRNMLVKQGALSVEHKDADLIYFLLHKSTQLNSSFILEDDVGDALKRTSKKRLEADLQAAIYTSTSPLSDEILLRDVAAAWGVSKAHTKAVPIIQEELEVLVKRGESLKKSDRTAWGIAELLEKINSTQEMRKRAIARRAIDNNIVEYDINSFYFKFKDGGEKLILVPQEYLQRRDEYFVNTILKNADAWQIVKRAVITPEMIDSWDKPSDYGWLAEEEGIPKTTKKEEKIAKLKEIYS